MHFTVHPASSATIHAIHAWVESGDESAAAWIVSHYRSTVENIAGRLPLWWQQQDAVQDTFAHAFCALHRYQPEKPFAHWLSVIAKHVCLKHQRTLSRRAPHLILPAASLDDELLDTLPCRTRPPDEILARSELCAAASRAFEALPDDNRHLFERHAIEGHPAHDLAAELGTTPGAVRVSVSRMRRQLQQRVLGTEKGHLPPYD